MQEIADRGGTVLAALETGHIHLGQVIDGFDRAVGNGDADQQARDRFDHRLRDEPVAVGSAILVVLKQNLIVACDQEAGDGIHGDVGQVVQQRLPGFEVLEGHVCSIPGSDRKFVHFITRGQGTVLSVILTERNGASLPAGKFLASAESAGLSIYEDHLSGMEIAGLESAQYFAFVVSDLSQHEIVQLARGLAPALNEKLHTIALLLTPNANDWLLRA